MSDLPERLRAWARAHRGPGATVEEIGPLPGNAGLSFSFTVRTPERAERLVLRLAPPGVPERGPNDVLRQVPLLRALAADGVPVAPVIWSSGDSEAFGSSALIVGFVDGRPLHMTRPELSAAFVPADADALVLAAVDALAGVHALDWRRRLDGWSEPEPLEREIDRWRGLFERLAPDDRGGPADEVHDALAATLPAHCPVGLTHGDFQTNNVLYADGRVAAIVDWELAGIGAQTIDLGWLIAFNDPRCWDEAQRKRMRLTVAADAIAERYEARTGRAVTALPWFRAFACYRFAAITAYNLMLHRRGKRVDPEWERLAGSRETLLARAHELLASQVRGGV